jgi:hypothetical protein
MREVYKNEDDTNNMNITREIRDVKELITEMTNPEEFPRNLMEDIDTESIEETERRKKI